MGSARFKVSDMTCVGRERAESQREGEREGACGDYGSAWHRVVLKVGVRHDEGEERREQKAFLVRLIFQL